MIGVAPQATIEIYQGPWTGNGPYDTLNAIVSDDTAKVISDAWAQCEQSRSTQMYGGQTMVAVENTLLQEAAMQGQTFLTQAATAAPRVAR